MNSKYYWLFQSNKVWHDKMEQKISFSASRVNVGNSLGCCITEGGDFEININRRKRAVGWRKVPVDQSLWGVVEICGKAVKIQSEFYCGELYLYNVYSVSHS